MRFLQGQELILPKCAYHGMVGVRLDLDGDQWWSSSRGGPPLFLVQFVCSRETQREVFYNPIEWGILRVLDGMCIIRTAATAGGLKLWRTFPIGQRSGLSVLDDRIAIVNKSEVR